MKFLFILLGTFLTTGASFGQDMVWPEDRATAELKVALYSDELAVENYRSSADNLYWLLINAPNLHLSIYQNGAKIYENLALAEIDITQKNIYLDSLMMIYDLRMKYFNDSINVMNRKSYSAYKHFSKQKEKYPWLLTQYDETIEVAGNRTLTSNLPAYMNVIKLNKMSFDELTLDDVFVRYEKITSILDYKSEIGEDVTRIKDFVDKILTETVPEGIDCNFVTETMAPKYHENPQDLVMAKRIFGFMLKGKCIDNPLFIEVAKEIQRQEPTYGIGYKLIGKKCFSQKDYECAESYFSQAVELASSNEEKVEVYIDLGKLMAVQGKKVGSRNYYRKVLEMDAGNKGAFEGIGSLYYNSAPDCAEEKSKVDDRLVYIAAYNMYKRADNTTMMQASKEQFPSVEELFNQDLQKGSTMTVGCWINEVVTLQTRD